MRLSKSQPVLSTPTPILLFLLGKPWPEIPKAPLWYCTAEFRPSAPKPHPALRYNHSILQTGPCLLGPDLRDSKATGTFPEIWPAVVSGSLSCLLPNSQTLKW